MKNKKIVLSVVSGLLVAAVAVGGTLAYLTDTTNTVTNTFNVGSGYEPEGDHVGLWLDEIDYKNQEARTETGNDYGELYPASIVPKDPTFHLTTGSTDSYVFAQVTGVDAMIEAGYFFTVDEPEKLTDPEKSAFNEHWVKVTDGTGFDGIYVYANEPNDYIVAGGQDMEPMFNWVKLSSDIDNAAFAEIDPSAVDVRGVAIQSANLTLEEAITEVTPYFEKNPF